MGKDLFGRYRLEERLGVGGWAEVWRATDERTGERVALKRLHPHVAHDAEARERLRREAEVVRRLDHPTIVGVRDLIEMEDEVALVLEHVDGEPLSDLLRRGPLPRVEALRIVRQVAEGLAAAHAAGIVHRDVKPANVLVDAAGAHLTDFGIARTAAASTLTGVGNVIGTLRYLAPEVLRGEPATPASDVWALGALAYELIERRPPFEAVIPSELVAEEQVPPPPPDHADPALATLLMTALDPDPVRRPRDAAVFVGALDAIASDAPTVLIAAEAPTIITASVSPDADQLAPKPDRPRPGAAPLQVLLSKLSRPGRVGPRVRRSPALAAAPLALATAVIAVALGMNDRPGAGSANGSPPIATPSAAATDAIVPDAGDGEGNGGKGKGKGDDKGGHGKGGGNAGGDG
jgi:serine/threonine protein kinase